MFEVGGNYANRIGRYTVLEINDSKMTVRYDSGETAELNMNIQYRIWENILSDEELIASKLNQSKQRANPQGTKFFVRPVNSLTAESLTERGWKEQVTIQDLEETKIGPGDRIIYYAIESQAYFAVGTITGEASKPTARDKKAGKGLEDSVLMLPLEIETRAWKIDMAVSVDSMEIESQPDIKEMLNRGDSFVSISEDDFELLAEALTEATEEDDLDEVEIDDDEEFEE